MTDSLLFRELISPSLSNEDGRLSGNYGVCRPEIYSY